MSQDIQKIPIITKIKNGFWFELVYRPALDSISKSNIIKRV